MGLSFTDPKSGIRISSNGSAAGNSFFGTFMQIYEAEEKANRTWIAEMRALGVAAIHPDDGWVDRADSTVLLCYPGFQKASIEAGDTIALGDHEKWRIVEVVEVVPSRLFPDHIRYRFTQPSTDQKERT